MFKKDVGFVELNPLKSAKFFSGEIRVKSLIYPDICRKKLLIFGDFIADFFSRNLTDNRIFINVNKIKEKAILIEICLNPKTTFFVTKVVVRHN